MVRFYYVDFLYFIIMRQLARYTAVAAADYQYLAHMRMHCHRHMDNHFVINKFVLFRKDYGTVTADKATEFLGFKNVYSLEIRIRTEKLLFDFDIQLHIFCMIVRKP